MKEFKGFMVLKNSKPVYATMAPDSEKAIMSYLLSKSANLPSHLVDKLSNVIKEDFFSGELTTAEVQVTILQEFSHKK